MMRDRKRIEFRKARVPEELDALCAFDQKAFAQFPGDIFAASTWLTLDSYWLRVEGVLVGCTAMEPNVDYDGSSRPGSLFISSTGVLPEFQGRGYGSLQKKWQIEYARENGFQSILTNMRLSNHRIIRLNEKFGFVRRAIDQNYYKNPPEPALVMELRLSDSQGAGSKTTTGR